MVLPYKTAYLLKRSAKGSCDKFVDIRWDTLAELNEKEGLLYVLNSKCSARDKNGNMLLAMKKRRNIRLVGIETLDLPIGKKRA